MTVSHECISGGFDTLDVLPPLSQVIPLVQQHCTVDEQRNLLYRSLREMPLRLLERVLPWIVDFVREEEEIAAMVNNMRLAGL